MTLLKTEPDSIENLSKSKTNSTNKIIEGRMQHKREIIMHEGEAFNVQDHMNAYPQNIF